LDGTLAALAAVLTVPLWQATQPVNAIGALNKGDAPWMKWLPIAIGVSVTALTVGVLAWLFWPAPATDRGRLDRLERRVDAMGFASSAERERRPADRPGAPVADLASRLERIADSVSASHGDLVGLRAEVSALRYDLRSAAQRGGATQAEAAAPSTLTSGLIVAVLVAGVLALVAGAGAVALAALRPPRVSGAPTSAPDLWMPFALGQVHGEALSAMDALIDALTRDPRSVPRRAYRQALERVDALGKALAETIGLAWPALRPAAAPTVAADAEPRSASGSDDTTLDASETSLRDALQELQRALVTLRRIKVAETILAVEHAARQVARGAREVDGRAATSK
jgi:hypothetical protein